MTLSIPQLRQVSQTFEITMTYCRFCQSTMIEPRYSRLSLSATSSKIGQVLPTGKSFGGSNLQADLAEEWILPIMTTPVLIENNLHSIPTEQASPLIVEVGKIFGLALWLWCLVGANFCVNSFNAIASYRTQNI
jgi:hypothetical protein